MFLSIAGLFFIPSRRLCLSSCYLAFVGSQDGAMATNDSGRDILGICGAGNGKRWRFRQKWTGGQTVARLLRSLQRRLHQPFLFCVFSPCSWITKREGWITRGFCGVCLFWMMLDDVRESLQGRHSDFGVCCLCKLCPLTSETLGEWLGWLAAHLWPACLMQQVGWLTQQINDGCCWCFVEGSVSVVHPKTYFNRGGYWCKCFGVLLHLPVTTFMFELTFKADCHRGRLPSPNMTSLQDISQHVWIFLHMCVFTWGKMNAVTRPLT